jgi:protein-tyrosine phosphatase
MVCTGNICRSPMAAALLHHALPDELKQRIEVTSAGTHALHGHRAQREAFTAMAELGIDIGDHRARQITKDIARGSDLILVMEAAHCNIVKKLLGWNRSKPRRIGEFHPESPLEDIADPYGAPLEAYRDCIRILRPCVEGVRLWLIHNLNGVD